MAAQTRLTLRRGAAQRSVAVVIVLVLAAAACGDDDPEREAGSTAPTSAATSTTAATSTETSTTTGEPATTDDGETSTTTGEPVETIAELRRRLGVDRAVVRTDAGVMAGSDQAVIALGDEFPGVFTDHLFVDGAIIDYAGEPVCPDFELLGDFHIIDDIESADGAVTVFVEDRRAFVESPSEGTVAIPRWRFDCDSGKVTELAPTTSVEFGPDGYVRTFTTADGLVFIDQQGLGDTPIQLTSGAGSVLIETSETAYDYLLSADEATVYFTTYASTGAAAPPDGVVAVDVTTGATRWRRDVGGFVSLLGDRLIIEEVDTGLPDRGIFRGREIVVVDPADGAELDRFAFSGRLLGLF